MGFGFHSCRLGWQVIIIVKSCPDSSPKQQWTFTLASSGEKALAEKVLLEIRENLPWG